MAMPHRQNPRRLSLLPEVGTIAAAVAAALFLALYGPPAHGADRSEGGKKWLGVPVVRPGWRHPGRATVKREPHAHRVTFRVVLPSIRNLPR